MTARTIIRKKKPTPWFAIRTEKKHCVRSNTAQSAQPDIPPTAQKRIQIPNLTIWTCCYTREPERIDRHLSVLKYCQSIINCERIVLFSSAPVSSPEGIEVVQIDVGPDFKWNEFVNRNVPKLIHSDYAMSVHEDGFPLRTDLWRNEFLKYDYIGAPWEDGVVGNGGFNIESRKLLQAKLAVPRMAIDDIEPSDSWVCRVYREHFERQGIRFAPTRVALKFATETLQNHVQSFGFHGRNRNPKKYAVGWQQVNNYPEQLAYKLIEKYGNCEPYRRETWLAAFDCMRSIRAKYIVETGCFRGTPADGGSTLILAAIAGALSAKFDSYELSASNIETAKATLVTYGLNANFIQGDSVTGLARRIEPIDFAYLDSFDCGLGPDYTKCQKHCLAECEAVLPLLSRGCAVLLDDLLPNGGGKPPMAMRRLELRGFKRVAKDYQVLYRFGSEYAIPRNRFAVLMGHVYEKYLPLALETIYRNRAQYCLRHGYDLQVSRSIKPAFYVPGSHSDGFSWSRLFDMLTLVESGDYDWVWCVGTDTLVTNFNITLESLTCTDKHVVIAGEAVAPIQADSFLVRSSAEGAYYLRDILSTRQKYMRHPWVENQAMIDLRYKHAGITQIVPQHALNAYDYSNFHHLGEVYRVGNDCYGNRGQWQFGDFIVHWAGLSMEQRMKMLEKYKPLVRQ